MGNSNAAVRRAKPGKPYPDFPLFPHATGRWAKKIRQKLHYFGPWDDWQAALEKYKREAVYLHAGRTPPETFDGLTVAELCNRFLTAKEQQRDAGDIVPRTFAEYHASCGIIVGAFGRDRLVDDLNASDFEALRADLAKRNGPVRLGKEVQLIRTCFKYGFDVGLLDKPIRFGPTFKKPTKRVLRVERQKKGPRMFEADEIRTLLSAEQPLRAMILLGVNCGFGNEDCGTLPLSAVDFEGGWIEFPRPKTAIERRCPLWPETVESLQEAIAKRPTPKLEQHNRLVFLTKYGKPWAKGTPDSPVAKEIRKLLDRLKLHRPGRGFYALRHTFETIAGEGRDQVAVNHVMGHADSSMAGHYRERISDDRLRDCVNVVRTWLFSEGGAE